jgi:1-acyl-sn-glycerol-3-phosphate acyltransferase
MLIFPEGHRSVDGTIQPFHAAGAQAALKAQRMPVWLVVTDGFWASPRLVDFLFHVHRIRGETEVLGPFEPPADDKELPAFLSGLRDRMIVHLEEMRRRHASGS